jgi:hypothetical protein
VTRRRRAIVIGAGCLLAASAIAQHELDMNLVVGGSRINDTRQIPAMSREIYTVNRRSGEMVYNRANAFKDPTYNMYQRYQFGPFDSGAAAVQGRTNNPAMRVGRANVGALKVRGGKSASSTHALTQRKYKPSKSRNRAPSLKQPTYRVSRGKW